MDRSVTQAAAVSTTRTRLLRSLKAIYVISVVVAIAWSLSRMDVLDDGRLLAMLRLPASLGFLFAWCAMVLSLGWLWSLWVEWRYDARLTGSEWLKAQALAWSGRYLPGKLGLVLGKLVVIREDGLNWRQVGASVLVEQMAFVAAGSLVGLLLLPGEVLLTVAWLPPWMTANLGLFVATVAAIVVLAFIQGVRFIDLAQREQTAAAPKLPGVGRRVALLSLYAAPHLLVGFAFYLLAIAAYPIASSLSPAHAIAALALAHVAGIVAVFAPAGLGVRELVLAICLGAALDFEQSLMLAAALRILTVAADALIAAVVAALWAFSHRTSSS